MSDVDTDVMATVAGPEVGPDDPSPISQENTAPTVGRHQRKPINKELFQKAAASMRAQLEGKEEELEVASPPVAEKSPEVAEKSPETNSSTESNGSAPKGPPPEAIAAWERSNLRMSELDAREEALRKREEQYKEVGHQFFSDPLAGMRGIVAAYLGDGATEKEIEDELHHQAKVIGLKLSNVELPESVEDELRSLKRERAAEKAAARKQAREAEEARSKSEQEQKEKAALAEVAEEFKHVEAKYPWVSRVEGFEGMIFEHIRDEYVRTGVQIPVEEAAKAVNEYVKTAIEKQIERYKDLLSPPAPTPAPARVPQGSPQTRLRTLTTADASEDGASAPTAPTRPLSHEERRKRTFAKWLPEFRKAAEE